MQRHEDMLHPMLRGDVAANAFASAMSRRYPARKGALPRRTMNILRSFGFDVKCDAVRVCFSRTPLSLRGNWEETSVRVVVNSKEATS